MMLIASLFAFAILESSPGDIVSRLLGDEATAEQQEQLREELDLDKPMLHRYGRYMVGVLQGDLSTSLISGRPVTELIGGRFLNTLILAFASIALAVFLSSGLGFWAAYYYNSALDKLILGVTVVLLAAPGFGIALIMTQIFSVRLGWLPALGGGTVWHFVLPMLALALPITAVLTRLIRTRMISEMQKAYTMAAFARGRNKFDVWRLHVYPNAIIPALTMVGIQFGHLLGGTFVIETLFAFPGLGRLTAEAILNQDFPVVLAAILLSALVFQLLNGVVDLIHRRLNPRMAAEGQR